jgi:carnitine-CoA ligase
VHNLADLLIEVEATRPTLRFGLSEEVLTIEEGLLLAGGAAIRLIDSGIEPGSRVAVVAETSTEYLVFWMACQLAGLEPALINPFYPHDLVQIMLSDLQPRAVATWDGLRFSDQAGYLALSELRQGILGIDGNMHRLGNGTTENLPGRDRKPTDCAGYMHTSGTTGPPKFCVQSHTYFLRLAASFVEAMELTASDRILAPLQMFHINPLGYGFIGGLTAGADTFASKRFRTKNFWSLAKANQITAVVLHAPPITSLSREVETPEDRDHQVRVVFGVGPDFLSRFGIRRGVTAYGSTEAAGITNYHVWHESDHVPDAVSQAPSRLGGVGRKDIEWRISADGEVSVRELYPGVLFSGYWKNGAVQSARDDDGWFATGDLGRVHEGELVFVERRAESIRVQGEYIPIEFVERQLSASVPDVDMALWKGESHGGGDELVLFVAENAINPKTFRSAIAELPSLMRPVRILRIAHIPRDTGVGKVQRRLLSGFAILDDWAV